MPRATACSTRSTPPISLCSEKDHLARAVRELDAVADRAERIADTLTIYAIKRSD
jgi:uncharacterized protein Yka (UPF0111/DUF47 family)